MCSFASSLQLVPAASFLEFVRTDKIIMLLRLDYCNSEELLMLPIMLLHMQKMLLSFVYTGGVLLSISSYVLETNGKKRKFSPTGKIEERLKTIRDKENVRVRPVRNKLLMTPVVLDSSGKLKPSIYFIL